MQLRGHSVTSYFSKRTPPEAPSKELNRPTCIKFNIPQTKTLIHSHISVMRNSFILTSLCTLQVPHNVARLPLWYFEEYEIISVVQGTLILPCLERAWQRIQSLNRGPKEYDKRIQIECVSYVYLFG